MAKRKPKPDGGNPEFKRAKVYREDYHPKVFIEMSREGRALSQICAKFLISRDTLHEWVHVHESMTDAYKIGKQLREAWHVNNCENFPKSLTPSTYIFSMKNTLGWKEKSDEEHDREVEGQIKIAKALSKEDRLELVKKARGRK